MFKITYSVTLCKVRVFELHNIGMDEFFHDLKLSILVALVLVYFFDGNHCALFICGLEENKTFSIK